MSMRRLLAGAAAGCLAAGVSAGPALADPNSEFVLNLDCGDGVVQVVTPPADADWTPAHAIDSTTVFQPLGFEGVTAEIEILDGPDAGTVIEFPADEDQMKNGKRKGVTVQECTFFSEFEGYEEELGATIHATYGGTVYLKSTAR